MPDHPGWLRTEQRQIHRRRVEGPGPAKRLGEAVDSNGIPGPKGWLEAKEYQRMGCVPSIVPSIVPGLDFARIHRFLESFGQIRPKQRFFVGKDSAWF